MNKKAFEDADTQQFKMSKEEPLRTSHMGSRLLMACLILMVVVLIAVLIFLFRLS